MFRPKGVHPQPTQNSIFSAFLFKVLRATSCNMVLPAHEAIFVCQTFYIHLNSFRIRGL